VWRDLSRWSGSCRSLLFALLLGAACGSRSLAAEPDAKSTARQVELAGGVKLAIEAKEPLDEAKLAAQLEQYARQLREEAAKQDAPPPSLVQLAPERSEDVPSETEASHREHTICPSTLLWKPPIANYYEPRFYINFTTLDKPATTDVIDFALGGTLPVVRVGPSDRPNEGVQLDLFVVSQSRFVGCDKFRAVDYRAGAPLTFALGKWSGKLSFEHTSTHLGDEFIEDTGARKRSSSKEEVVFGLAYNWMESSRVYGQIGHALHLGTFSPDQGKERYNAGVEWRAAKEVALCGRPFAAADLEFRGDEGYTPNFTAQLGWEWHSDDGRSATRLSVEYYDGRSPFGQFIDQHESFAGIHFAFDF
jgi:hypothetical protein